MRAWWATIALVVLIELLLGLIPIAAQDLTGTWQNVEFAGIASVEDKCQYATIRDYRYMISPDVNGQRIGAFSIAETRLWLTITDQNCAFPGEGPDVRAFLRIMQWDGRVRSIAGDRWELGTGPGRCMSHGCRELGQGIGPILSQLERRGPLLLEKRSGIPPNFPPLPFRTLEAAEHLAQDAASSVPALMKGLDEGNCFNWYRTAWAPQVIDPAKIGALCSLDQQQHQATGDVLETRVVSSWTLGLDPRKSSSVPDNIVLVAAAAVFGNGTNVGRFVLLRQHDGKWRIINRFGR